MHETAASFAGFAVDAVYTVDKDILEGANTLIRLQSGYIHLQLDLPRWIFRDIRPSYGCS